MQLNKCLLIPLASTKYLYVGIKSYEYAMYSRCCNTPGVCHQLSNEFEFKHDMLSGAEGERSNLQE